MFSSKRRRKEQYQKQHLSCVRTMMIYVIVMLCTSFARLYDANAIANTVSALRKPTTLQQPSVQKSTIRGMHEEERFVQNQRRGWDLGAELFIVKLSLALQYVDNQTASALEGGDRGNKIAQRLCSAVNFQCGGPQSRKSAQKIDGLTLFTKKNYDYPDMGCQIMSTRRIYPSAEANDWPGDDYITLEVKVSQEIFVRSNNSEATDFSLQGISHSSLAAHVKKGFIPGDGGRRRFIRLLMKDSKTEGKMPAFDSVVDVNVLSGNVSSALAMSSPAPTIDSVRFRQIIVSPVVSPTPKQTADVTNVTKDQQFFPSISPGPPSVPPMASAAANANVASMSSSSLPSVDIVKVQSLQNIDEIDSANGTISVHASNAPVSGSGIGTSTFSIAVIAAAAGTAIGILVIGVMLVYRCYKHDQTRKRKAKGTSARHNLKKPSNSSGTSHNNSDAREAKSGSFPPLIIQCGASDLASDADSTLGDNTAGRIDLSPNLSLRPSVAACLSPEGSRGQLVPTCVSLKRGTTEKGNNVDEENVPTDDGLCTKNRLINTDDYILAWIAQTASKGKDFADVKILRPTRSTPLQPSVRAEGFVDFLFNSPESGMETHDANKDIAVIHESKVCSTIQATGCSQANEVDQKTDLSRHDSVTELMPKQSYIDKLALRMDYEDHLFLQPTPELGSDEVAPYDEKVAKNTSPDLESSNHSPARSPLSIANDDDSVVGEDMLDDDVDHEDWRSIFTESTDSFFSSSIGASGVLNPVPKTQANRSDLSNTTIPFSPSILSPMTRLSSPLPENSFPLRNPTPADKSLHERKSENNGELMPSAKGSIEKTDYGLSCPQLANIRNFAKSDDYRNELNHSTNERKLWPVQHHVTSSSRSSQRPKLLRLEQEADTSQQTLPMSPVSNTAQRLTHEAETTNSSKEIPYIFGESQVSSPIASVVSSVKEDITAEALFLPSSADSANYIPLSLRTENSHGPIKRIVTGDEAEVSSIGQSSGSYSEVNLRSVAEKAAAMAKEYSRCPSAKDTAEDTSGGCTHQTGHKSVHDLLKMHQSSTPTTIKPGDNTDESTVGDSSLEISWLFDALENTLGPMAVSADMASLSCRSARSSRSLRSEKSKTEITKGSRHSATSGDCSKTSRTNKNASSQKVRSSKESSSLGSRHSRTSGKSRTSLSVHNVASDLRRLEAQLSQLNGRERKTQRIPSQTHNDETKSNSSPKQTPSVSSSSATTSTRRISTASRNQVSFTTPPGRLGIILANRADDSGTIVASLRPTSPLVGKILPGDRIVAIDGENVSDFNVSEVTATMARKSDQERVLTVITPIRTQEYTSSANWVDDVRMAGSHSSREGSFKSNA